MTREERLARLTMLAEGLMVNTPLTPEQRREIARRAAAEMYAVACRVVMMEAATTPHEAEPT